MEQFKTFADIGEWLKPQLPAEVWFEMTYGKWADTSYYDLAQEPELAEYRELLLGCQMEWEIINETLPPEPF